MPVPLVLTISPACTEHATILLKTGVPPNVVSKRLGHASVAFTLQVYSWVLPGQQREAAEGFAAAVAAK